MASKEIGLLCPSRINNYLLVSEIPLGTDVFYHNPNLGLATKARICEGEPRVKLGSHISCSRECGKVWGNEPPHPKVGSHFGSWSLHGLSNLHRMNAGVKPIELKSSLYHWKLLGTWMSRMGSHYPFGYFKHKLWPKEGLGIKLSI
jgi:hypothetical protein